MSHPHGDLRDGGVGFREAIDEGKHERSGHPGSFIGFFLTRGINGGAFLSEHERKARLVDEPMFRPDKNAHGSPVTRFDSGVQMQRPLVPISYH